VVRRAWPFFSYNITQVGYSKIAIVFFGLVALPEKVGWFAAAFAISDVIPQWSYASCGALLPLWTRLFESNRIDELVELRQKVLDLIIFLAVPLGVALAIFAPEICHILGSRFANSVVVLRIVAYRSLLAVLDGFLGHGFLIAINKIKERQVAQAWSAVLLGVLTLSFGYVWGPVGVAVALLISDSTLIYQYLRIASRSDLKVECPAFLSSVAAGLGMALVTIKLSSVLNVATLVAVALITYSVLLIALTPQRLVGAGRTLRESFSG
jgi:O-antigen/teichoic acid export membrane protein